MSSKVTEKIEKIKLTTNWPVGPVNVYLLFGDKITLVDTGLRNKQTWDELNQFLHNQELKLTDIDQIVLTHHHNDHAGLLDWIIERHPIPIYAHRNAQPYIARDPLFMEWSEEFFTKLYLEFGMPSELAIQTAVRKRKGRPLDIKLTKELQHNDSIPNLPEWRVLETKGHSQDHVSLYNPTEQLLICGDHMIKGKPSGIFIDPPNYDEERSKPLIQYIDSLNMCMNLHVKQTFSGHGSSITNLVEVGTEQLYRIENRISRVKKVLQNSKKTGFEIVQEIYSDRINDSLKVLVSDVIGILDLLENRQEVAKTKTSGVFTYQIIN